MKQYHDLCRFVLDNGIKKEDRTGTGTISYFSPPEMRFDLQKGFPLLTTKRVFWRGVVHELLWIINGDTNIKYLVDNNVHIWDDWAYEVYKNSSDFKGETIEEFADKIKESDEFSKKWGGLGPVYGSQWRKWTQITDKVSNILKKDDQTIETDFNKEIKCDYSNNEKGFIGKTFKTLTGECIAIREYRIERKGIKNGKGNLVFDLQFIKTGYIKRKVNIVRENDRLSIKDPYYPNVSGVGCFGENVSDEDRNLLYGTWTYLLKRCYDPKHHAYPNYGGKGVFVCKRWLIFKNFVEDVKKIENWLLKKEFPHEYTLDKDYYGSNCYSPSTCIWLSKIEQNLNVENAKLIQITNDKGEQFYRKGIRTICNDFNLDRYEVMKAIDKEKSYGGYTFKIIDNSNVRIRVYDQIKQVIADLKHNPESRRIIINAWNVAEINTMSLAPCHAFVQFYVANGKLSCKLLQR